MEERDTLETRIERLVASDGDTGESQLPEPVVISDSKDELSARSSSLRAPIPFIRMLFGSVAIRTTLFAAACSLAFVSFYTYARAAGNSNLSWLGTYHAAKAYVDNPLESLTLRALGAMETANYHNALNLWSLCLGKPGDVAEPYELAAMSCHGIDDFEGAAKNFDKAIAVRSAGTSPLTAVIVGRYGRDRALRMEANHAYELTLLTCIALPDQCKRLDTERAEHSGSIPASNEAMLRRLALDKALRPKMRKWPSE